MPKKIQETKKAQEREVKKPLPNKKLLTISITLAVIIILGAVIWRFFLQPEIEVKFSLKAAIIDQLSEDFYNETFVDTMINILSEFNFTVEYYNHTRTKVEFFEGLAEGNYGIVILRTHAALRKNGSAVDFFTSEIYDERKYTELQSKGFLVQGELNISQTTVKKYFAFTPSFVRELKGTFPKSIIIAMGCQTLNQTAGQSMAKAFCDVKKAKVYIGWSSWVSAQHSDMEIIKLMKMLLQENKTIGEAVRSASKDPLWASSLEFYPESARDLKISDLVKEARALSSSTNFAVFGQMESVNRFNSLATVVYSWFRRFSPVKFALFNFPTSSAKSASSRTSFIHFSKSPR